MLTLIISFLIYKLKDRKDFSILFLSAFPLLVIAIVADAAFVEWLVP